MVVGERKDDEAGWGWPGRLGSATDVCGTTTKDSGWLLAKSQRRENDDDDYDDGMKR